MDLVMMETGNGGDLVLTGVDLEMAQGLENIPYMLMFGGKDWWGNEFLDPLQEFNSLTETALRENPLSSNGRIEIEKAIKADLAPIIENVPGTKIAVVTQIVNSNKLSIEITINGQQFRYLWNPSTRFLKYLV